MCGDELGFGDLDGQHDGRVVRGAPWWAWAEVKDLQDQRCFRWSGGEDMFHGNQVRVGTDVTCGRTGVCI